MILKHNNTKFGIVMLPASNINAPKLSARAHGKSNNFIYNLTIFLKSWILFLSFSLKVLGFYKTIFCSEAHSIPLKHLSACHILLKLVIVFQAI